MKRNTWRKSSDEVIIEIKDSPTRERNYWNLRGGGKGYNYSRTNSSNERLKDEVSIEISLNEGRTLTEEQKQNILETLLHGSREEFERNSLKDSLIQDSREEYEEGIDNSLVQRSGEEAGYYGVDSSYSKWNTLLLLLILLGIIVLVTTTGKF